MDGARPFIAAYDAGWKFEAIVLSEKLLKVPLAEMIARRLAASGVPIERVSPEDFRSVCQSARASGIGAIVSQRWSTLDQAKQHPGHGWLVIESIQAQATWGPFFGRPPPPDFAGVSSFQPLLILSRPTFYAPPWALFSHSLSFVAPSRS